MTKKEVQQRVLQNGKPLDLYKFSWDEKTKTFSSSEDCLVLDFREINNCTFDTSSNCTFDTSSNCTFDTGYNCTFNTSSNCTFDTSSNCIFNTSSGCTFNTGSDCTFNTGSGCVVVRRDIYEVIELEDGKQIKLNGFGEKGFTYLDEKKEMTVAEISEKLGYDIKIIK